MSHGIAATKGHSASNGGLRGHSIGDVFPFIVVGKGIPTNWFVLGPDGSTDGVEWDTAGQAEEHAAYLKSVHTMLNS